MPPRPFLDPVTHRWVSYATATARVQQYAQFGKRAAQRLRQARTSGASARTIERWRAERDAWAGAVVDLAEQRRALIHEALERVQRRAGRRRRRVGDLAREHFFGGAYRAALAGNDIVFEVMVVSEEPITVDVAERALRQWLRLGVVSLFGVRVETVSWTHRMGGAGRWRTAGGSDETVFDDVSHLLRAVRWSPSRHGVPKTFTTGDVR